MKKEISFHSLWFPFLLLFSSFHSLSLSLLPFRVFTVCSEKSSVGDRQEAEDWDGRWELDGRGKEKEGVYVYTSAHSIRNQCAIVWKTAFVYKCLGVFKFLSGQSVFTCVSKCENTCVWLIVCLHMSVRVYMFVKVIIAHLIHLW